MSQHRTSRSPRIGGYPAVATVGLVILAGTALSGCGGNGAFADPGPTATEQRPADGIHAVDLRTSGDLTITTGPTPKLTITAGRTTLRNLTSSHQNGTVVLGSRGHYASGDIHYDLTLPTLDGLVVAGSGSAHGTVVADGPLAVAVSGSGSAALDGLAATTVTVELCGSGDIHLAGTTGTQSVKLAGSGNYVATDLISHASDVQVDGSGNAHVNALSSLNAQLSGSGNISYTGTPALTTHISGNGTIRAS
jgi:hypothetical protein